MEKSPSTDDHVLKRAALPYSNQYGESDLFEGELRQRSRRALTVLGVLMLLLVCVGGVLLFAPVLLGTATTPFGATSTLTSSFVMATMAATATVQPLDLATNTPRPAPSFVTVTPAPPTQTPIPPPTPCIRIVQPGDTLYAIALACGYREASIIDVIVAENELSSPDALVIGQEIIVPPPTQVSEQATTATETSPEGALLPQGIALAASVAEETRAPGVTPTATLQPGVMWHIVQPNETMLAIAVQYGANAEILSQLNPEVPFLQCDFEFDSGGPRCIVQLGIGQQIRVPAPTATPTIPPTPSGSETPTPTMTPTFNAPSALSPGDRALFQSDQLVTLRWVTTGTLATGDVYRVQVRDITSGREFSADTRELFLIVPSDWQGRDQRRHEYEWSVSVLIAASESAPVFATQPRTFIWESRPGGS
jgi:LysM repeat protein